MIKRKKFLFLAILLVVAAQYGARTAMAFCDNCEEPAMSGNQEGWTVTLAEPVEESPGSWIWTYTIQNDKGTTSGLNFAAMLNPDCCSAPKITVEPHSGFTEVFPVGEGEPTLNFGKYNKQAFVVKGTPVNSIEWSIKTNTNVKTSSTFLLKVKKIGVVTFEMAVPGCNLTGTEVTPEEIFESSEEFTYVNAAGRTFTVTVIKNQYGDLIRILRTCRDASGDLCPGTSENEDITATGIKINNIRARFPIPGGITVEELFNYVPSGTVTKTDEDSTCGYWYGGYFYNFCF